MSLEFKVVKEVPQGKPTVAVLKLGGWLDAQGETLLVEAVREAKAEGAEEALWVYGVSIFSPKCISHSGDIYALRSC